MSNSLEFGLDTFGDVTENAAGERESSVKKSGSISVPLLRRIKKSLGIVH